MRRRGIGNSFRIAAFCVLGSLGLQGCAMLHSEEETGTVLTDQPDKLLAARAALLPGMTRAEAIETLGVQSEEKLQRMSPEEINKELYGGVLLESPFDRRAEVEAFFKSMSGFWVHQEKSETDRSFGWTASESHKTGRIVRFAVIFKDDVLYKVGTDIGGPINQKEKDGYLNGFTPAEAIKSAKSAAF